MDKEKKDITIKLAKTAGFCFGVKRAVNTVYEQIEKGDKLIYTYGPIIHNEEVVKDLEEKGVKVIESEEDIGKIEADATVVIRSHGTTEKICDLIKAKGANIVDATCPFVKKIHNIVAEKSEAGYHIVIIGNDKHPEVEGIKGWSKSSVTVINTEEEANSISISDDKNVCIV